MRFLLKNITKESKQATRLATKLSKRNTIKEGIISSSIGKNNGDNERSSTSSSTTASDTNRTWGQQCSPTCGCVLRIEAHMDNLTASSYHSSPRISSASYNAKTIVTTIQQSSNAASSSSSSSSNSSSSYLEPVMTQCSNPRPIMKECTCTTLHSLASAVVNELPKFTLTQAQNQLEFTGVRSSPAFRYSVLSQHQLLPQQQQQSSSSSSSSQTFSKQNGNGNIVANDGNILKQMNSSTFVEGKCYDLVEEALIACLKGYMPKPRRTTTSIDNHHGTGIAGIAGIDDHNRLDDQPIRQPSLSYSSHHHHHHEGDATMNDYEEARNSLDPLRFVRAAKNRLKHRTNYYTDSTSTHDHSSSSSSSSSSLSSSSSTHSSMPPFHFMNDSHHSQDHISTIDTLSQLQMDLCNDKTKRIEQEGLYNDNDNDFHGSAIECWQSYVDELHMAQEEKEEQPNTA